MPKKFFSMKKKTILLGLRNWYAVFLFVLRFLRFFRLSLNVCALNSLRWTRWVWVLTVAVGATTTLKISILRQLRPPEPGGIQWPANDNPWLDSSVRARAQETCIRCQQRDSLWRHKVDQNPCSSWCTLRLQTTFPRPLRKERNQQHNSQILIRWIL